MTDLLAEFKRSIERMRKCEERQSLAAVEADLLAAVEASPWRQALAGQRALGVQSHESFHRGAECCRAACCFKHMNSPREHGFCCNACRLGDSEHTRKCTGYGQAVVLTVVGHQDSGMAFRIPEHWACKGGNVTDFVGWYVRRFEQHMTASTYAAWVQLERYLPFVRKERPLVICIMAEDSRSLLLANMHATIKVHERGLEARAPHLYNMGEVTGVDFAVQAVLVGQEITPVMLLEACRSIETRDLRDFTFVSRHATHGSCGCAVLLAILVYHNACIIFQTSRTKRAALERGMVPT